MSGRFSRTIYVGNLPADIRESEIEDLFYKVCVANHVSIPSVLSLSDFSAFCLTPVFYYVLSRTDFVSFFCND